MELVDQQPELVHDPCPDVGVRKVRARAPRRITLGAPGTSDTPRFPGEGEARAELSTRTTGHLPVPRAGRADEVAEAILLTLRNDYMTGATIDVDGGAVLP